MDSLMEGHASLPRLRDFEESTCIAHHVFGREGTELVRKE